MDESTVWMENCCPKVISEKVTSGELVFRERESKSRVWDVFAKLEDRNGVEITGYVCCLECRGIFKYTKVSSTSNLVKHKCYVNKFINKPKSPISIIEIETPKLEILSTYSESADEIENPLYNNDDNNYLSNHNNDLTKLIAECLVKYCRSYDFIQDDGLKAVFQEFLSFGAKFGTNVNVDKILPSSTTVARNLADIYKNCFQRVKLEISKVKEKGFGIATAVWTDDILKKNYIAVTIHFFKNEALKFRLLGLRSIEGEKYTSQIINAKVEEILKDFDCKLSSKSIIVTTENCDNFNKSTQEIKKIPSTSHLLKNALQKAIEEVVEVSELIRACEKLVNFCKKSEPNTILSRSLNSYCPSRSNTVYKMLYSIENYWSLITRILRNKNEDEQYITINTNHLKALIKTLQPFEEAIEALVDDNVPTLHLVFVYLHELKKFCATDYGKLDFIKSLKVKLQSYLHIIETHNITNLHKLAVFLYPPANKMLKFTDKEKKFIEDECICLMKCLKDESKSHVKQEAETTDSTLSKREKLFSDFIETDTSCDSNELIMQELEFYKNTRVLYSENFDVFRWWELQKNNFPLLYKLSYMVLTTPASSAAPQKIILTAGSMLCEKLSDFSSKELAVQQIMFVNSNAELDSDF